MAEARVRVSLSARELEVEGSVDFVERFTEAFEPLIEKLTEMSPGTYAPGPPPAAGGIPETVAPTPSGGPLEFGEMLHGLPKSATDTDRILLAGYHTQTQSADATFSTTEAHTLLIQQGVRLSNASQSLRNNQDAKRAFKVGKRWRVSKLGEVHLRSLGVPI